MTSTYLVEDAVAGEMRRALSARQIQDLYEIRSRIAAYGSEGFDKGFVWSFKHDQTALRWELLRRVAFGEEPASCLNGPR